jgi:hypothetical protein
MEFIVTSLAELGNMSPAVSADHHWLVSESALAWLQRAANELRERPFSPAFVKTLRRDLGTTRTPLVLDQVQLRARAAEKFSRSEKLFFTAKGLEQATDEAIARYKSLRFPAQQKNYDFCCGIGGDAFGLLQQGPVHLVDRDELTLFYALENVRRLGGTATGEASDVSTLHFAEQAAWHIDPDRRLSGKRTTQIELGEPGLDTLNSMLATHPQAAIKLAPATQLPEGWQDTCAAEWIESRGECRQLVAWFGELASDPTLATSTLIGRDGTPSSFRAVAHQPLSTTTDVAEYLYDPAPAILAAGLLGAWCEKHGLQSLSATSRYLTHSQLIASPLHQTFRHLATLPLDIAQLRAELRGRKIGRLEIKQRGIGITPETLRPQLQLAGEEAAVLILSEIGSQKKALLCERLAEIR